MVATLPRAAILDRKPHSAASALTTHSLRAVYAWGAWLSSLQRLKLWRISLLSQYFLLGPWMGSLAAQSSLLVLTIDRLVLSELHVCSHFL